MSNVNLDEPLKSEAEKKKKELGLTGDYSLNRLLDIESEKNKASENTVEVKDGFSASENKSDTKKQERQELRQKNLEEKKIKEQEYSKQKTHDYTIELLYHFNCGECKGWWSYATTPGQPIIDHNTKLIVGDKMFLWEGLEVYCPHCGHSESTKVKEGFLDNFEDDLTVGEQHQTYSDYWNTPLDPSGNILKEEEG